jgi:hypothetical protein
MTKHIIAYSGGHSSALVAVEVCRKFGKDKVVLLNHNISPKVEPADVKRFKAEIADYLGLPITYANHPDWETETPVSLCVKAGTWVNPANRQILCTNRLKTAPFYNWLSANYRTGDVCYYGFDKNEPERITRRSNIMGQSGYKTDYPLALWRDRTIYSTNEIGIAPPLSYDVFKHANCIGCIKAGWQHWYVIYCLYSEIYKQLIDGEEEIGHSVHGLDFASDKAEMFEQMQKAGIVPTEKTPSGEFWATAKRELARLEQQKTQFSLFDMPTFEKSVECTGDCKL